jgi:uncharacterized membrane protein
MQDKEKIEKLQKRIDSLEKELGYIKLDFARFVLQTDEEETETEVQNVYKPKIGLLEKMGLKGDIEYILGGNILGKFGLLAIILATLWFIKYAFDNFWINESGRIYIGLLIGLFTISGSLFLARKNLSLISSAILGSGYTILYISIVSAYYFYSFFSIEETFVYVVFISFFTAILSDKTKFQTLYTFSFIGSIRTNISLVFARISSTFF